MFSPPYGDGTNSNRVELRISVFAPLRGWYCDQPAFSVGCQVFAPLRGWYTKYITEDRKMEELNA